MTATYTEKDFHEHLLKEHKLNPFSQYLREIVYGGNDGIVTTFAVVAGFTGAQSGGFLAENAVATVLLFGFANLFADGASMSLGNFLSIRSAQDVYKSERNKETHEVHNSPEMEKQETHYIFKSKGFSENEARKLTEIVSSNPKYWVEFMMKDELEIADPTGENPFLTGTATFISFVGFGLIPLLPYIFFQSVSVFNFSVLFTFFALVLLGILRFKVTQESPFRSIGEIVLIGGISALIAYIVGTLFRA